MKKSFTFRKAMIAILFLMSGYVFGQQVFLRNYQGYYEPISELPYISNFTLSGSNSGWSHAMATSLKDPFTFHFTLVFMELDYDHELISDIKCPASESLLTYDVALTADDGYIICGTTGDNYGFLAKFNADFFPEWARYYPGCLELRAISEYKLSGGNVKYVACGISGEFGTNKQAVIMGVDNSGIIQWFKQLQYPGIDCSSEFNDIESFMNNTIPPDMEFAVTGSLYGAGTSSVIAARITNNGATIFANYYKDIITAPANLLYGNGIAIDASSANMYIGGTVIHGSFPQPDFYNDFYVLKLNSSNGNMNYSVMYKTNQGLRFGTSIAVNNEFVHVAGYHENTNNIDATILRTLTNGNTIELKDFGTTYDNEYLYKLHNTKESVVAAGYKGPIGNQERKTPYVVEYFNNSLTPCYDNISIPQKVRITISKQPVGLTNNSNTSSVTIVVGYEYFEATQHIICEKEFPSDKNYLYSEENIPTNENEILVSPTFTHQYLTVKSKINNNSYRIYSLTGMLVSEGQLSNPKENTIDVSELPKGIYAITIYSETSIYTTKFIKQ
jgi:hypothetical protein